MARQFQRQIRPVVSGPADPLGAGVNSFANSLNAALIRNQSSQQKQGMQSNSLEAALNRALINNKAKQQLAEDPNKTAPKTNPKSPMASAKANEQFWDWNDLDKSFKTNPKLAAKYIKDADTSYKGIKDGIRKDPSNIGMDEPTVSKQAMDSLKQSNPQYFNLLSHHVSNVLGGGQKTNPGISQGAPGQGVTFGDNPNAIQ